MDANAKVFRPYHVSSEGSAICIESVCKAVADRRGFSLADGDGRLRPASRKEIIQAPGLTSREVEMLLETRRGRRFTSPLDGAFDLAVPLPPVEEFRSDHAGISPLANFMRWADEAAGRRVHPGDVLVHLRDLDRLLEELRAWLRDRQGLRGERLAEAVAFHDVAGAPCAAGRRSSIAPGWAYLRLRPNTLH